MPEEVLSKRRKKKSQYKGNAPINSDNLLFTFSKMIIQVTIFTIVYTIFINDIKNTTNNNLALEFLIIFTWLITSDLIASFLAITIKIYYNYKMGYLNSGKRRVNYNRKIIEYIIYTSSRAICYAIGLTPALSNLLYPHMPILWGLFAYFIAWLIISLSSRVFAKLLSIYITKSV
ncbi:MAG: hypothetical protein ACTSRP_17265 [Candidatus Helarchaeota archaeon]